MLLGHSVDGDVAQLATFTVMSVTFVVDALVVAVVAAPVVVFII